jgi:putative ABC transport system permease protein
VIALRNLWRAPARTLLTVLGVAVGVALFVAVRAITTDIQRQIADAAGAYGLELVIYERRATSPFSSRITPAQMDSLRDAFGEDLTPLVLGTRNEPWNAYALVLGVPASFAQRIPLRDGGPWADASTEVLVGEVLAMRLGLAAGDSLPLDGRQRRIAGVYRTGSRMLDGAVMLDLVQAQAAVSREGAERQYSIAVLRATDAAAIAAATTRLDSVFPRFRAIPGTEFAGAMRLLRVVEAFVRTLGVIAVLGTALVVVNTLLMAVGERTRELGILMAIGWRPRHVLRMLAVESLLLCVAGGVLGNLGALALLRAVNASDAIGVGWIPVRYPISLAVAAVGMSVGVAVIALLWPAVLVSRVRPLTALRHE